MRPPNGAGTEVNAGHNQVQDEANDGSAGGVGQPAASQPSTASNGPSLTFKVDLCNGLCRGQSIDDSQRDGTRKPSS